MKAKYDTYVVCRTNTSLFTTKYNHLELFGRNFLNIPLTTAPLYVNKGTKEGP